MAKDSEKDKMPLVIEMIDQRMREIQEQADAQLNELLHAKESLLKTYNKDKERSDKKSKNHNGTNGSMVRAVAIRKPSKWDGNDGLNWAHIKLPDAIDRFLKSVGGKVLFATLLEELTQRNVRLGNPEKPARYGANLKVAIVNNKARFNFDKKTQRVSLKEAPSEQAATATAP